MIVSSGVSAGRPPAARVGESAAYNGRPVVAGVGSYAHPLSSRASVADLWSTLDIAAGGGETALQRHGGMKLDAAAQLRLRAYVNQARQYFEAVAGSDPVAKPLLGYYFVLNASKVLLTAINPALTDATGLQHGIGQHNQHLINPYAFDQEYMAVKPNGVFQEVSRITGQGLVWGAGVMQLSRLIPYLVESTDLYTSALEVRPALIPVEAVRVEAAGKRPNKEAWLTVEISRLALREADLSPRKVLDEAAAFADRFDLVDAGALGHATYQSKSPVAYAAMPGGLPALRQEFDRSMIMRNRAVGQARDFIVLSPHAQLISNEALTFAVMLHLSNIVRYRPHHAEALRAGRYWWLFTSWVDRACENFLLAVSSRIALEEHLIL